MTGGPKPASLPWDTVLRKSDDVVSREIAGETILVPIRGRLVDLQRIFSVNPVGAHIWNALDGATSLADLRETILATFEAAPEEVDTDIREFIAELLEAGLVQEMA